MVNLKLKLPALLYEQLQSAADEQNRSVDNLLVDILAKRFPPQTVSIEEESQRDHYQQFATEWAFG